MKEEAMTQNAIRLIPGPVEVPNDILEIYSRQFGSADLEEVWPGVSTNIIYNRVFVQPHDVGVY